jgi:ElaB/YqjD/DUF883 family membrane-anchored ribosome-binding protein
MLCVMPSNPPGKRRPTNIERAADQAASWPPGSKVGEKLSAALRDAPPSKMSEQMLRLSESSAKHGVIMSDLAKLKSSKMFDTIAADLAKFDKASGLDFTATLEKTRRAAEALAAERTIRPQAIDASALRSVPSTEAMILASLRETNIGQADRLDRLAELAAGQQALVERVAATQTAFLERMAEAMDEEARTTRSVWRHPWLIVVVSAALGAILGQAVPTLLALL